MPAQHPRGAHLLHRGTSLPAVREDRTLPGEQGVATQGDFCDLLHLVAMEVDTVEVVALLQDFSEPSVGSCTLWIPKGAL